MKLINRIIGVIIALFLLALLLIWLLSPLVSRSVMGGVLEQHGLVLDKQSSVRLNPFASKLSIKNLSWMADQDTVFRLDALSLKYSLWRLFSSEVHVKELSIDGVKASLLQSENKLIVVGIDVSQSDGAPETNPDPTPDPVQEQSAGDQTEQAANILVELDSVSLSDIELSIDVEGQAQQIKIKELALDDLAYNGSRVDGRLKLDLSINERLSKQRESAKPQAELALPLIGLNLNLVSSFEGDLGDVMAFNIESTRLGLNDIVYGDGEYQADVGDFTLDLELAEITLGETVAVSAGLGLVIEDILVRPGEGGQLAKLEQITLPTINVQLEQETLNLAVDEVVLAGAEFLSLFTEGSEDDPADLAAFSELRLSQVSFNNDLSSGASLLSLASVNLTDLLADVRINQDGELEALAQLVSSEQLDEAAPEQSEEAVSMHVEEVEPRPEFKFQIATIQLGSSAKIKIDDASASPNFAKTFVVEALEINNLSNQNLSDQLDFNLRLKDQEFFQYDLDGTAQPFSEKMNLSLNSVIKEFAVHEISPYLSETLGFSVEAGQLDSDANIVVLDDMLDGKVKLNLRGAKFSSNKAKADEELDMIGQAAIPLNVALNMLKDGKGNIKLTIPVDGDVNDPSFGVQYILGLVVKKAVMSQAKKHLVNTFIPYGQVLSVAYSAGSYALKVRFEDLPYERQQTELSEKQNEFAKQFTDLLKKKEKLQVRMCPIATVSELSEPAEEALSEEQRKQLIELAKARGAAFKLAATDLGVDSSRLLICSPEIDLKEDALPRIKFSI